LIYSQVPTEDQANDIQRDLADLRREAGEMPQPVRNSIDIFCAHVQTVLREQPAVNALLNGIAAVPTASRLDEFDSRLAKGQRDADSLMQTYRKDLFIFAAGLAGLLLYVGVKLIRSHAIIQRVNHELVAANETLEQRVQERTRELRETQSELVATARQAGMAEIATNVLHNVGNVLNSVNVSADLISTRLRESKVPRLADAARLITDHTHDLAQFLTQDERGKHFPGYFDKIATALSAERTALVEEIHNLTKGIDHIREIVATQQSHAGTTCLVEPVQVGDLLEDALRMNAASVARRQVAVSKDCSDVPTVLLDKHLILQILINLIANALQAMDGVVDRAHRLTLKAQARSGEEGPRLCIEVEDTGEGIASDNLPRLFTHGFTTRKSGHGFGLHSCALAARAMGGRIAAQSLGSGQGATFTLDLPLNEVPVPAVASL
jgi:signal transduction histidine kinase